MSIRAELLCERSGRMKIERLVMYFFYVYYMEPLLGLRNINLEGETCKRSRPM